MRTPRTTGCDLIKLAGEISECASTTGQIFKSTLFLMLTEPINIKNVEKNVYKTYKC